MKHFRRGLELRAVQFALFVLFVAVLLALRPASWGAIGGVEFIPGFLRAPRVTFLLLVIGLLATGSLLIWSLARSTARLAPLGIVPLVGIAANGSARLLAPLQEFARDQGFRVFAEAPGLVQVYAIAFRGHRALGVMLAALLAIAAVVLTLWRAPRRLAAGPMALVAALAFATPLIAYLLLQLGPVGRLTMTSALGAVDVPYEIRAAAALETVLPFFVLLTVIPLLLYWQSSATALLANEYASALARRADSRAWAVVFAILSLVKLIVLAYGYSGRLPQWPLGTSAVWAFEVSWIAIAITGATLAALLKFHPRPFGDGEQLRVTKEITVAAIVATFTLTLAATIQLIYLFSINLVPGWNPELVVSDPLIVPTLLGSYVAAPVLAVVGWLLRRRYRTLSVMLFIISALQIPDVLRAIGLPFPIFYGPVIDVAISILFAGHALAAMFAGHGISRVFATLWIGSTVVMYAGELVPDTIALSLFGVALVFGPLYSFYFRAGDFNQLSLRRPDVGVTVIVFTVFVVLVGTLLMYMGDRYGRGDNWALLSWNSWTTSARWDIALPILITIAYITSNLPRQAQSRD